MLAEPRIARVLFRVLGRRTFALFAVASGFVVFLLAAVNLASHSALERYVADQLRRLPWDMSVYQTAEVPIADDVFRRVAGAPSVRAAERLYFLRVIPPFSTVSRVDGEVLRSPWLSLLTGTDPAMLPPELSPQGDGVVLVLVGAKAQMGSAFDNLKDKRLYQLVVRRGDHREGHVHSNAFMAAREAMTGIPWDTAPAPWQTELLTLRDDTLPPGHFHGDGHDHSRDLPAAASHGHAHGPGDGHDHAHEDAASGDAVTISKRIERVVRMDPGEINRWFMEVASAPTLVPEIGLILVARYDADLVAGFDAVARGFVGAHEDEDIHGSPGEYFVDVLHLARYDRAALLSGWDIDGSLGRLAEAGRQVERDVRAVTLAAAVDNTVQGLFRHLARLSSQIALISLLVSLPLLLLAGILLANLANLLLLNARRTLGLLRLRGVPGRMVSAVLLATIAAAGLVGGLVGAALGTAVPLLIYAGGWLPWAVLLRIQPPLYVAGCVAIGTAVALVTGWRLVRFAATISPLEAASRVSRLEASAADVRFGLPQAAALLLGIVQIAGWFTGRSPVAEWGGSLAEAAWWPALDRALDFVAFPLFVYGLASLIASRRWLLATLMAPLVSLAAGSLRLPAGRHLAIRRHRVASLLLIVGLLASLALYPSVMTAVFDDKTERGAKVQLGGDIQIVVNALDLLSSAEQARGDLLARYTALRQRLDPMAERVRALPGVRGADYLVEGLVEGLYMPDRGFGGIPLYLVRDPQAYLAVSYHEPELGRGEAFAELMQRLDRRQVLLSTPMAAFYKREVGGPMPVGRGVKGGIERATYGGAVRFLPALPLRTVADRDGLVAARVDYLNHLFGSSPYLVGAVREPQLQSLDVLIPRVVLTVALHGGAAPASVAKAVRDALGVEPLDMRIVDGEIARLGSDMYVFLARRNMQIYLVGGCLLALIGIAAVAYANFLDDRRTLALLRIRGGGGWHLFRFVLPGVLAPAVVGLAIGGAVALIAGFGITQVVWELRELETVMSYLRTRLAASPQTLAIAAGLIAAVLVIAVGFGRWASRRAPMRGLSDS